MRNREKTEKMFLPELSVESSAQSKCFNKSNLKLKKRKNNDRDLIIKLIITFI